MADLELPESLKVKKEDIKHITDPKSLKPGKEIPGSVFAGAVKKQQENPNQDSGMGNTDSIESLPNYIKAGVEKVIAYKNINAFMVFGRDRPSDRLSGYGGAGVKNSSAIDMVAGRMGPIPQMMDFTKVISVDNNYRYDAARLLISQRTDVDNNFGINASTPGSSSRNLSAIAAKADSIRLIGRKDIKIVSGTDNYDSKGNLVGVDYTIPNRISLIGDNRDDLLQPMIKGENLASMLTEMLDIMSGLVSSIDSLVLHQNAINQIVINHTHTTRVPGKPGFFSFELITNGAFHAAKLATEIKSNNLEIVGRITDTEFFYLLVPNDEMSNESNILSNHNFCT